MDTPLGEDILLFRRMTGLERLERLGQPTTILQSDAGVPYRTNFENQAWQAHDESGRGVMVCPEERGVTDCAVMLNEAYQRGDKARISCGPVFWLTDPHQRDAAAAGGDLRAT